MEKAKSYWTTIRYFGFRRPSSESLFCHVLSETTFQVPPESPIIALFCIEKSFVGLVGTQSVHPLSLDQFGSASAAPGVFEWDLAVILLVCLLCSCPKSCSSCTRPSRTQPETLSPMFLLICRSILPRQKACAS